MVRKVEAQYIHSGKLSVVGKKGSRRDKFLTHLYNLTEEEAKLVPDMHNISWRFKMGRPVKSKIRIKLHILDQDKE